MALTGTVSRWFNRKGYGFINVMNSDSEHVGNDIFVHLSGINVKNDGYKCLYPGEYVSFDLDNNNDGNFLCKRHWCNGGHIVERLGPIQVFPSREADQMKNLQDDAEPEPEQ